MAIQFDPAKLEAARARIQAQQPQPAAAPQEPPPPSSFADRLTAAAKSMGNDVAGMMSSPTTAMKGPIQNGLHLITDPLGRMEEKGVNANYPGHPHLASIAGGLVKDLPEEIGTAVNPVAGRAAEIALAPPISMGKEALGKAEGLAGVSVGPFGSEDLPMSPKEAIDFSQQMGEIAKTAPEKIAQVMDGSGINYLRKVIEYTLDNFKSNLPGTNLASISKAKEVLTRALDTANPELAAPRADLANAYRRQEILSKIPFSGIGKAAKKAAIGVGM